ncbi:hypothetical protein TNCT_600221 [Trichonephila clavata]|uniref:Uncharacterized protein n=1 Tax=Trichonephila clavata TaxID=2740835 RepID=A0A8X6HQR0_TRICU|nr:hypothetical protein TNCT_600221 [Trichonephila clavata]
MLSRKNNGIAVFSPPSDGYHLLAFTKMVLFLFLDNPEDTRFHSDERDCFQWRESGFLSMEIYTEMISYFITLECGVFISDIYHNPAIAGEKNGKNLGWGKQVVDLHDVLVFFMSAVE